MFKIIFFILLFLLSDFFALEISMQSAKESNIPYSTLNISNKDKFLCQETKDDFENVTQIVCAFAKEPSQEFKKINNNFFEVTTQKKDKTFFLIVKPLKKIKLYPIIFDLKKEQTVFDARVDLSNKWMIVGYSEKIPFLKESKTPQYAINFPFTADKDRLPSVGSLDFKGNPVHIKKVGDVTEYIRIIKSYNEKSYDTTLYLVDDVIKEYPNSLFMAELLFYKIKVLDKLEKYEDLIPVANKYLKEFSSDDNVAEVLSLIAKAYGKTGLGTDAEYFYDRLFDEHGDSVYAKWGLVYMAEYLEASGGYTKARELYKRAIDETKDIDVALSAGFKLAKNLMGNSNYKEASEYVKKIVGAKPEFFYQNKENAINMMDAYADAEHYTTASIIAKALLQQMDKNDEFYEKVLRGCAIWLSKSDDKKSSLEYLNRYMDEFSDGRYINEIKVAKDGMFFEADDENQTQKLQRYDSLIAEYKDDTIGAKALYEKAKLLNKMAKYEEVLMLEKNLLALDEAIYTDMANILKEAAIGSMNNALDKKECSSVLTIASKHNVELSKEWHEGVYECAMKGADFALAKKIASDNIKSKDINERKKWLYRFIKVDFATGNYSNVLEASKELITLIKEDKDSPYKDIYRYIFDTYQRVENPIKMVESIGDVIRVFNDDYKDVDRYMAVMSIGNTKKDSNLVIEYGKKVLQIEKNSTQKTNSPSVEFMLYDAYIDKKSYKEAMEVIKSLDKVELKNNDRARQKYLLGNALAKLWRDNEAKSAYEEAVKADPTSAWAKLAKNAKDI